ncbi:MAG: aldo/keto reductase [Tissierellia bacterium]|nr:aldo/keto reductase [Tissierellia bacterium]
MKIKLDKLILGTWKMGDIKSEYNREIESVQYAVESGINYIDTAEMYGDGRSEALIGEALKGYDRSRLFLISKVLPGNANKRSIYRSVENSLKNMKTDYLDLYLLHWIGFDTNLEEVVILMEDLKRQNLIRNWGVSNFDTNDMKELFKIDNGDRCVTNQVLYNLDSRGIEYDLLPYHNKMGIATMAYCPMAHGLELNYKLNENELLISLSKKYEISIPQILLNFVLSKEGVSAVAKSSRKEHINQMLESRKIEISKGDFDKIDLQFPAPRTKQPLEVV